MKDDRLYLIHIKECIERIEEYVAAGKTAFLGSTLIQDAVVRNLQIIGQSAKNISPEIKLNHPEVDWPQFFPAVSIDCAEPGFDCVE